MSLKYQLDSLDGLSDDVKALYKEKDGKYVLAIEGMPEPEDVSGLKAKVDELLKEKKDAAKKAKDAEEAAAKAAEEKAKKDGDIEALDKSWKEKFTKRESELNGLIDGLRGNLDTLLIDNVATTMAAELAIEGSSDVLKPHILSRLAVETRDGKPVTVVKGPDGKASALTVDELKAEISNNKAFAPVIAGSRASGSGAGGQGGGGAGAGKVDLAKASPKDAVAHIKSKKGE